MKKAKRFRVGSRVVMSEDALANYGEQFRGHVFRVSHVAVAYMPASEFFAAGKPKGFHPGYDYDTNSALYDFQERPGFTPQFNGSLYDWELEPAPRIPRNRRERMAAYDKMPNRGYGSGR